MQIRIGYDIVTKQVNPTPVVLLLQTRPELKPLLRQPDDIHTEPEVPQHEYIDSFGNRCVRLIAPPGMFRLTTDALIENNEQPDEVAWGAIQHPIEALPDECMQF